MHSETTCSGQQVQKKQRGNTSPGSTSFCPQAQNSVATPSVHTLAPTLEDAKTHRSVQGSTATPSVYSAEEPETTVALAVHSDFMSTVPKQSTVPNRTEGDDPATQAAALLHRARQVLTNPLNHAPVLGAEINAHIQTAEEGEVPTV